ncbi:MAG: tRNA pseudouridine(55) synthase TruB [Chloroflexi bacterium]|nr:tRNA pseudouridine(55) synthase TruB [Chloroflexota bacterium]
MGKESDVVGGLLLLDKPMGITSHDAVARARRWLGTRRVGHAGTLDPMATGLLTLCIGQATRLVEYLVGQDKHYSAVIRLGARTNTDDAEGEVVQTYPVPEVTSDGLAALAARFLGEIEQVPPQFSAIKKDGVRAYARARQGEEVDLAARRVQIYSLVLRRDEAESALLHAEIHCGSGTYVRALARDIGMILGCGAHLSALRRTAVGNFDVKDALTADDAQALADQGQLAARLRPADTVLSAAPLVNLNAAQARGICRGQSVRMDVGTSAELCRVYGPGGVFLAVGSVDKGLLRPIKVLAAEENAADTVVS